MERCNLEGCIRAIGHDGVCRHTRTVMDIILGPGDCSACGARVWWAYKGIRGGAAWRERTGDRHYCRAVDTAGTI